MFEDFSTLCNRFIGSLRPGGDYVIIKKEFLEYLTKITEDKDSFNESVYNIPIAKVTDSIIRVGKIGENDVSAYFTLIQDILLVYTRSFCNGFSIFSNFILEILNPKNSFYNINDIWRNRSKNGESLLYRISKDFFENSGLPVLIDHITNSNDSQFKTFLFICNIFMIVNNKEFDPYASYFITSCSTKLFSLMTEINEENFRQYDTPSLSSLIKFILNYLENNENSELLVKGLLSFSKFSLNFPVIDKQFLGALVISSISSKLEYIRVIFQDWIRECSFGEFLLDRQFSSELLNMLTVSYPLIFLNNSYNDILLKNYWIKIENSHISERKAMFLLLAYAFHYSIDESKSLFTEFLLNCDQSITLNFFEVYFSIAMFTPSSSTIMIINHIFSLLSKDLYDEYLLKVIKKISEFEIHNNIQNEILRFMHKIFNSRSMTINEKEGIKIMISKVLKIDYSEISQLYNNIIEKMLDTREPFFIEVFEQLSIESNVYLTEEALIRISKNLILNSQGVAALFTIFHKRGLDICAPVSRKTLLQLLNNQFDISWNISNAMLVWEVFIIVAYDSKNITSYSPWKNAPSEQYSVINPMAPCIEVMLRMIIFGELTVSDYAISKLLKLFKGCSDHNATQLCSNIINIFESNIYSIKSNPSYLSRLIYFLSILTLQTEEKKDLILNGLFRHKESLDLQRIGKKVIFHLPDGTKYQITVLDSWEMSSLFKIVGQKLKQSTTALSFKNGTTPITFSSLISSFKSGDIITVQQSSLSNGLYIEWPQYQSITAVLQKSQLGKFVFDHLNDPEYLPYVESLWGFLKIIPTIYPSEILSNNCEKLIFSILVSQVFQLKYFLQIAIIHFTEFNNANGHHIIIDLLTEGRIPLVCLSEALYLISSYRFETLTKPHHLIQFLLSSLSTIEDKELAKSLLNILKKIILIHGSIMENILTVNSEFLELVFFKLPIACLPVMRETFILLKCKSVLINQALSISSNLLNDNIRLSELFLFIHDIFDSTCDFTSTMNIVSQYINTEEPILLSSICALISRVIEIVDDIPESQDNVFYGLLDRIQHSSNFIIHQSLFRILYSFSMKSLRFDEPFKKYVYGLLDISTDRWGYNPDIQSKGNSGFTGLRNLGATCYMNSVFQALFWNPSFRRNFMKEAHKENFEKELALIFARLVLTEQPYVDTQGFVSNWSFIEGSPVNPRQQQDAVEFIQCFLDRISSSASGQLYTGKFVRKIVGIDDEYEYEITEPFFSLSLEIKQCQTFNDSFNLFVQTEIMSGYNAESLKKKIDVKHFTRVRDAPSNLIIQLKRFEYDIRTFQKIKINDRFEFPEIFDMGPLMEDSSSSILYHLNSVIVHNGSAQGGHYTCFIKNEGKWIQFDDRNVTIVSLDEFKSQTFGKNVQNTNEFEDFHQPSAYLLFYSKEGSPSCEPPSSVDVSLLDLCEKDAITIENDQFITLQTAFGDSILDYLMKCNDYDILIKYFVNILIHSNHGKSAFDFSKHLAYIIVERNNIDDVVNYLIEKYLTFSEAFIHCQEDQVINAIMNIFEFVIPRANINDSYTLVCLFMNQIPNISSNWRSIPYFLHIPVVFALVDDEHQFFSMEKSLHHQLLSICINLVGLSQSTVFKQNVDFSELFALLQSQLCVLNDDIIRNLINSLGLFINSPNHSQRLLDLISVLIDQGLISISQVIDSCVSNSGNQSGSLLSSLFTRGICEAKSQQDFNNVLKKFLRVDNISMTSLLSEVDKSIEKNNQFIKNMTQYGSKLMYLFAISNEYQSRSDSESTYLTLFPHASAMYNYTRAESYIMNSSVFRISIWKDHAFSASGYPEGSMDIMVDFLNKSISHCSDIIEHPTNYMDNDTNERFVVLFRVLYWLSLRTYKSINDKGARILMEVFIVLCKLDVKNNVNIIELMRIISSFSYAELKNVMIEYFPKIIKQFETNIPSKNTKIINEVVFMEFINAYAVLFRFNSESLYDLLSSSFLPTLLNNSILFYDQSSLNLLQEIISYHYDNSGIQVQMFHALVPSLDSMIKSGKVSIIQKYIEFNNLEIRPYEFHMICQSIFSSFKYYSTISSEEAKMSIFTICKFIMKHISYQELNLIEDGIFSEITGFLNSYFVNQKFANDSGITDLVKHFAIKLPFILQYLLNKIKEHIIESTDNTRFEYLPMLIFLITKEYDESIRIEEASFVLDLVLDQITLNESQTIDSSLPGILNLPGVENLLPVFYGLLMSHRLGKGATYFILKATTMIDHDTMLSIINDIEFNHESIENLKLLYNRDDLKNDIAEIIRQYQA